MVSNVFAPRTLVQPSNPDTLRAKLSTEPEAIINFLVNNNPNGIADNLEAMGFNRFTSKEEIRQALTYLAGRDLRKLVQALNVKIDPSRMGDSDMQVVRDLSRGFANSNYKVDVPVPSWQLAPPSQGGPTPTQGNSTSYGEDQSWSDVAVNLGNMAANLINAITGKPGAAGGNAAGGGAGAPPEPKKDNTWLYVGIGVVAVVLITIVVIVFRKKK